MSTEVTKSGSSAIALSEPELLKVLSSSLYPGAHDESIKMVLGYCKATGLDPMQKPVHIVPMWDSKSKQMRDVIMPGIGLYRTQAARSGCAGVSEPEFGPDVSDAIGGINITYPAWCRVTVKRRLATGEVVDFTSKEFWKENYAVKGGQEKSPAPNAMWTKRPYGQLAKCAEAQALRKAFPEIGSVPTDDEMAGKSINEYATAIESPVEVVRETVKLAQLPDYSDEQFAKNLPAWRGLIESTKKTADQIIAMVSSKARLSEDQVEMIRATVIDVTYAEEVVA